MLHAVPEQLQGQLGVLHVAVGQQQQVPEAAGGRQQAEGPQGPPQLGAAPYWSEALRREGRRHGEAFKGFGRLFHRQKDAEMQHKVAESFTPTEVLLKEKGRKISAPSKTCRHFCS